MITAQRQPTQQASKPAIRLAIMAILLMSISNADTIQISLDSFSIAGFPGTSVTFSGTLQNSSGSEVFLNGAGASLSYSELTLDLSSFFTLVPLSIPDGQSYSGPLFSVAISNVALSGDYSNTFTIQGGADSMTFDTVGTADFQVNIASSVPEPGSFQLICLIAPLLCFVSARSRKPIRRAKLLLAIWRSTKRDCFGF